MQQILLKIKDVRPIEATQTEIIVNELLLRERLQELRYHYAAGYELLRSQIESRDSDFAQPIATDLLASLPPSLGEELGWRSCREYIGKLMRCASAFACAAPYLTRDASRFDAAVSELLAWEVRGYRFADVPAAFSTEVNFDITPEHVRNALSGLAGYEDVKISSFERLMGGVSKVTVVMEGTTIRHGKERFVLRGESFLPILDDVYLGMDLANEFYLLRYLHRAGAPVAEPLILVEDRDKSPRRFFLSRWMPGKPPGDYLLRIDAISPALCERLAFALASLHRLRIDLQDPDLSRTHLAHSAPKTREAAVREFIVRAHTRWQSWGAPASTLLSVGAQWLLENVPASTKPPCIIHNDCGLNNFLVKDDEVSAIVDWETCRLGDPTEDVVWLMFATGGALDESHFLKSYIRAGGEEPDPFARKYYEVLARVRILWAQVDVQMKYESVSSANVILCAMALGQADRTVDLLDKSIRDAEKVRRETLVERGVGSIGR